MSSEPSRRVSRTVTKAVIPAAGLGTRFLPATKATPKEMLPVVDKPAIQYVVEEAVAAGLTDVLMITGRNKRPLEDHFDRALELEQALEDKATTSGSPGSASRRTSRRSTTSARATPAGSGTPSRAPLSTSAGSPSPVLLGDDLIDARDPLLATMLDVRARFGGCVVALLEVPHAQISSYGCAAVEQTDEDGVVRIVDLVEKPPVDEAPSNLAIIGRYVLSPEIFDVLAKTEPGRGGEIQLTDALMTLTSAGPDSGGPVHGVVFRGRRYDTGDRLDYLKAVVRLACDRDDIGPDFRAWLDEFTGPEARRRRNGRRSAVRSVDDHLARITETVAPLAPLHLQILDAAGCILAEDVVAATDLPPFDNSAMDGYAVRAGDVSSASEANPVRLPVVGDVAAGSAAAYTVQPGFTTRIMTGAPVPAGTEAVVPVEWTDGGIATVTVTRGATLGQHIRRRGDDVRRGDTVLPAGTRLGATHVGLLAAVGRDRVTVRPRPRVVVLSTGSELVEPGHGTGPGQISESNSYMLTTAVKDAGALGYRVGIVPDDPRRILGAIEDQLIRADLVVTTGGVSAGPMTWSRRCSRASARCTSTRWRCSPAKKLCIFLSIDVISNHSNLVLLSQRLAQSIK
jgi:UTP--glucose-1-phosphate uridylyltransferase